MLLYKKYSQMTLNVRAHAAYRSRREEGPECARGPRPAPSRALPPSGGKRLAGQGATEGSDAANALLLSVRCPDVQLLFSTGASRSRRNPSPAAKSGG